LQPIPSKSDGLDGRIDQVINSKQQLYVRYNWKNILADVANPLLPNDVDTEPLLSKTGENLATRVANGGFACPELEFGI
jgi:hypothetical protein